MNLSFLKRLLKLAGDRRYLSTYVLAVVAILAAAFSVYIVANFMVLTSADRFVQDWEVATIAPSEPQDPNIVVVAIDEQTLAQLTYRSPVDRAFLANLLSKLISDRPRAIGIDLLFDQKTEPEKDAALEKVLTTSKVPLVVAYTDSPAQVTPAQSAYVDAFVPRRLRGDVHLAEDQFGTTRWIYPGRVDHTGHYVPGFVPALAAHLGVVPPKTQIPLVWHGKPSQAIPVSKSDDVQAFKEYPAYVAALLPASWIAGKVVLIGSDESLIDRHRWPYAAIYADIRGTIPGIMIHAHGLSQLLDHRTPPYASWEANFAIALLCAIFGGILGVLNRHLAPRLVVGFLFLVLLWLCGAALYHYGGPMIGLLSPSLAFAIGFSVLDSLSGREARKQRQFIQGAFSRYVSPKVVEQLIDDPEKMSLAGERREMTYLFTDIANFTTLSEGMESHQLGHVLNAYLDGVTQVVLRYEGMVDKFIGDSVFAIFNAPVDLADHAARAVKCALEIDVFCDRFSAEQKAKNIDFGITRIGVHTGVAVVGNFGSSARFNYTAQGDAVNTASRLEGLNKYFGTHISVSGATREQCNGMAFRPVASVVLKGKTAPVDVWEPLQDGAATPGYLARYREAFEALEQEKPQALALFEALGKEAPEDPCVALYVERLRKGIMGTDVQMKEK
ncbi:MAG: adenylate/guanylate cyclase domain-containing protein [Rhizomicrobium sp.]